MRFSVPLSLALALLVVAGCPPESEPGAERPPRPMPGESLQQATTDLSGKARELNNMGLVACQKKDYPAAASLFERAVAEAPDQAALYNNLGRTYYWMGDYRRALGALSKALELQPNAAIHANVGDVFRQKGVAEEAIYHYHRALELDPGLARVHYELGNLFLKTHRRANAIFRFDKAIELDPDFDRAYLARAIANHLEGNDGAAARDLEELERRGFAVDPELKRGVLDGLKEEDRRKRFRPGM